MRLDHDGGRLGLNPIFSVNSFGRVGFTLVLGWMEWNRAHGTSWNGLSPACLHVLRKIAHCRGPPLALVGGNAFIMALIRSIFWFAIFLGSTFVFTVLFEHGPANFSENSKKEYESLTKL